MRRIHLLLALSAPLLLLAGCGADSYFCDHSGCYYCDGVGCRPTDPPDPVAECAAHTDCDPGFLCTDGQCRPEDEVCQFSYECGGGRVCVDGRCAAPCTTEDDCAADQLCDAGYCRPIPDPGPSCDEDVDCGEGGVCDGSSCAVACAADGDCAATEYCDAGVCRFDDRPLPPVCTLDTDCLGGRTCLNGVCRTPCAENLECQLVDVQLTHCFEGLCVTDNEVNSNCITSADCAAAQSCVDGVCR